MRKEFESVDPSLPFGELAMSFFESRIDHLYLTGERGELLGVIAFTDLRSHLNDRSLWPGIRARDVATSDPVAVMPSETLLDALNKFAYRNAVQLPVVSDPHDRKLIGVIRRGDLLNAYQRSLTPFLETDPERERGAAKTATQG